MLDISELAEADAATYVQPDGIHFTRAGYRALGLRVAETLEEALIGRKAPPRTAIYPGLKKPPPQSKTQLKKPFVPVSVPGTLHREKNLSEPSKWGTLYSTDYNNLP